MIRTMTRRIPTKVPLTRFGSFRFSYDKHIQQELSRRMNAKIEVMKQSIAQTTPRSFSLLFMAATLPAFYFINELIQSQYNDPAYTDNANRFYKYYYLYNMTFFGCSLFLSKFNFRSPSSMYALPKKNLRIAVIPLILSFVGLMLPQTDSKHMVWPAFVTQIGTMAVQGSMANRGMLPFWFYSYRHFIGLFTFILFAINFMAMYRLSKRRKSHPHQFVDIEKQSQIIS